MARNPLDLFKRQSAAVPRHATYGPKSDGPSSQDKRTAQLVGYANLIGRYALIPLALLWQEIVFKASTTGGFWPQMIFVVLFSLALGFAAQALTYLLKKERTRAIVTGAILLASGVLFCVEYFVYREFKLFYDVNTVTAGAGDAATGFADQIQALVFSVSGIMHILLFLLPAILYGVYLVKRGEHRHGRPTNKSLARLGMAAVGTYLLAIVAVSTTGNFWHSYTDQYSFQEAVTNFGLATGVRKELAVLASGSESGVSFSTPSVEPGTKASHAVDSKNRKEYGTSSMDIDFEALAATTEGTWADLDHYVASLTPSSKNKMTGRFKGFNLIFVSAEALSDEAIREDTTPTLWRLAHKGIQFSDYYQFDSSGTTGGECNNIFGLLPTEGGSSVKLTADHNNYFTMGNMLNRRGYDGWAFHNNTYTYYSRDLTHNNLGYNFGYMGYGNGMEEWVTWQWPQSDLEMMKGTFDNLYGSKEHEPFNVYYMSVSGHSGYVPGENMMSDLHADEVAGLPYSDPVKGYLACNIELDKAMEYLVKQLEKKKMADRTLIVMSADHFPYGLDDDGPLGSLPYTSELYGYDVNTYFQRDHNRLIMWSGCLEDEKPIVVNTPVFSDDILPTLLNLFGCEWDSRLLPGRDVFSDKAPLVYNLSYHWKSDLGTYYADTGEFVPNEGAEIPEGYVEATNADVANRINYCRGVLTTDYYRHVFGEPDDVAAVHDAARAKLSNKK